jgi:membrane-associated phospholipid phosphatase
MARIDRLPKDAPESLRGIERADLAVAKRVGALQRRPAVKLLGQASEMADQPPMIALAVGTLAGGLLFRRPAVALAGLRMLAAHAVATGIKTGVKRAVDRTRPHVLSNEGEYLVRKGRRREPRYNSFPSGHTAGAVAAAEAVARTHPPAALPARLWAAAIAAIQVPRGAHYPSDVSVGAAIGLVADRVVRLAEKGLRRRLRADRA